MDSLSRKRRLSGSISPAPRSCPSGQPAFRPAFHQTSIPGGPTHIHGQSIQNGGSGSISIGRDNIAVTGDLHIGSNGPGGDAACLRDLRATDPRHDKTRIEQTKGGLLPASYHWILDNAEFRQWRDDPETRLLRIMGDPGKGKSMLLCGIINELTRVTDKSLSFFFCQGTDARINSATAVLRGLIYMLVSQQPSLIEYLSKQYDHAGRALFEDANAWVALSEILADILRDPSLPPAFIVIDALDECTKDLPSLLSFISRTADKSQAKWLVSSRNIIDIERGLRLNPSGARLSLKLKQNAEQVAHAVDAYINHCVSQLPTTSDVSLHDQIKDKLREKADGTFLWVSLVIQELRDTWSWNMLEVINETPSDLTSVYRRMMDHLQRRQRDSDLYLEILSIVTTAYRPLHLRELVVLSKLPERCSTDECSKVVAMCGSFLTVREEHVYIVHQSAKDFLSADASLSLFPSGVGMAHHAIVSSSLQRLSTTLRRDIYNLGQPGIAIKDVSKPSPDPLFAARYACTY
ncbi:ankyrin repeat domain-containing protein 50 [Microdochium nivale]|nr:ankyrin repeat domain-containing protein 50 [Microdochium nivale]